MNREPLPEWHCQCHGCGKGCPTRIAIEVEGKTYHPGCEPPRAILICMADIAPKAKPTGAGMMDRHRANSVCGDGC